MEQDYQILKKLYGESFAKICRTHFPTILETPGALARIITTHFAPTHSLAEDLQNPQSLSQFKAYIYEHYRPQNKQKPVHSNATPEELMAQAGYILYPECKTEADIQKFKKYYDAYHNEILCTFNGHRLDTNRVWFAVKKNVAEIKREYYLVPERQNDYGTSVLSIQFTRDQKHQTLSIKNRYNHTVHNPDSTFSNNLDNIIVGLSQAFEKYYGCRNMCHTGQNNFELSGYVKAYNGKYYRENFEWDNTSFCENNTVVKNGQVYTFRSDSQILADHYLFDLHTNQVYNLSCAEVLNVFNKHFYFDFKHPATMDGFTKSLGKIQKIDVTKDKATGGRILTIYAEKTNQPCVVKLDKHQQIVGYQNHNITAIDDMFMLYNRALTQIEIPNVTKIGDGMLLNNHDLQSIDLSKVTSIGDNFLSNNSLLQKINIPNVTQIGKGFLANNFALTQIAAPKLTQVGNYFISDNTAIRKVYFPNLKEIGKYFLMSNVNLSQIELPKATNIRSCFLNHNEKITNLDLPNVLTVEDHFLTNAYKINQVSMPNLLKVGDLFLRNNYALSSLNLPSLKIIGDCFLENNKIINSLRLPNVTEIGESFLTSNTALTPDNIYMPKVKKISSLLFFFCDNFERGAIVEKLLKRIRRPNWEDTNNFDDIYDCDYDADAGKLRHLIPSLKSTNTQEPSRN